MKNAFRIIVTAWKLKFQHFITEINEYEEVTSLNCDLTNNTFGKIYKFTELKVSNAEEKHKKFNPFSERKKCCQVIVTIL